jgi:hypothetical protein
LKFLKKGDYVSNKGKIINNDSKVEVFNFRWNEELICQRRMHRGREDYHSSSNEDEYSDESDKDCEYDDLLSDEVADNTGENKLILWKFIRVNEEWNLLIVLHKKMLGRINIQTNKGISLES